MLNSRLTVSVLVVFFWSGGMIELIDPRVKVDMTSGGLRAKAHMVIGRHDPHN